MGHQHHKPGAKGVAHIQRPGGPDASRRAVGHQTSAGLPNQLRHCLRAARLHTGQHLANTLPTCVRVHFNVRFIFFFTRFLCPLLRVLRDFSLQKRDFSLQKPSHTRFFSRISTRPDVARSQNDYLFGVLANCRKKIITKYIKSLIQILIVNGNLKK